MSAHEIRAFATTVRAAAKDITPDAEKVMFKGAMNVKRDLQKQMRASRHFKGATNSITFDQAGLSVEIGPEKASGSGGAIANVAYFGTSRGGGTVEDPLEALNREAPYVEKYLLELVVKSFE
ncbi:hypothetical protein [Timonella senegalensis]|uniref:hypothetical protein n=1 Tax=Timonella senegalensis TaxID=1465825 RepID=UPI0002F97BF2|nr:hypothetical protein [Timonella senegalensis]